MEYTALNKDNFKHYLPDLKDIVAFSYAEPGAMGYRGQIIIIPLNGGIYTLETLDDEFTSENIYEICPVFKDCKFSPWFGNYVVPEGWSIYYLGSGNHLVVKESFKDSIDKKIEELNHSWELYSCWKEVILETIQRLN